MSAGADVAAASPFSRSGSAGRGGASALPIAGLDGEARTGADAAAGAAAAMLLGAPAGAGTGRAAGGPFVAIAGGCEGSGGTYAPDHLGFLGSCNAACWTERSPNPRLIVSLSEGTVPTPTGCGCARDAPAGRSERDWAHPASARASIPTANFRFMCNNFSILGEFAPGRPKGCGESRATVHYGRFPHVRPWRTHSAPPLPEVIGPTRRHGPRELIRAPWRCALPRPQNSGIGFLCKVVSAWNN